MPVDEAPSRPAVTAFGEIDLDTPSYAEIRRRAQARRAVYLRRRLRRVGAWLAALSRHASARAASRVPASRSTRWLRPELLGCVALTTLSVAMIGWPALYAQMRPCRTEPAVLAPGSDLAVTMTVSHSAACSIATRPTNVTVDDLDIAVAPKHGNIALRGRTGVTYRPGREFTGDDFFAFALRGKSDAGHKRSLVQVRVIVK